MIIFAAISPHPPIILPSVGSLENRKKVKKTIASLKKLAEKLERLKPELIIISSPHPDWGFEVPLYFLAKNFQGEIKKILTGPERAISHFKKGKDFFSEIENCQKRIALIASGDLSHCSKKNSPYGFHSDGPKFDQEIISSLKNNNIKRILELENLYPEAGECGLRSICFLLGILEINGKNYRSKILSYQNPWGIGYLTVDICLKN
jgi:AmmeMemoRadiSam system protein B